MQGDPQRLKQILTNLVGNAIKFTQGGTVAVRAMLEDESDDRAQLRISVQDTGIGLSEEDQQALFKAFSQADNSLSRQAGGTGLGLVISKRLIEQMGGEIGVDSTPGEGAEFWISLSLPKSRDDNEEPGASLGRGPTRGAARTAGTDAPLAAPPAHRLRPGSERIRRPRQPPGKPAQPAARPVADQPGGARRLGRDPSAGRAEPVVLGIRTARLARTLVLCPTTEQAQYSRDPARRTGRGQARLHRKLQRKLQELLQVRPTRSDKPTPWFPDGRHG